MCHRFSRAKESRIYLAPLEMEDPSQSISTFRSWNIAPATMQPVIYRHGLKTVRWGCRIALTGKSRPLLFNCRLDDGNVATWKTMWKIARVVVPADGWYEWVAGENSNMPYFVKPIDDRPLYFAALASFDLSLPPQLDDGFVLVTSGLEAGIVDTHARRPLTLNASDARRWLESRTTFAEAKKMVVDSMTPKQIFRSFRVSVGVNHIGNDERAFNDPLPDSVSV